MAIGTITVVSKTQIPGPLNIDQISFAGDAAYGAGGTAAFQASVRAALGKGNVTILHIIPVDCGGYVPMYDTATDKLKVMYSDNNNASDGPLIENATANISATTFKLMVVSK